MEGRTTAIATRACMAESSNSSWPFSEQVTLDRAAVGEGPEKSAVEGGKVATLLRRGRAGKGAFIPPLVVATISAALTALSPVCAPARAVPQAAQSAAAIAHVPAKPAAIPPPGAKMKITAFLEGSKRFEQPMRVLITRDHKLLDIWLPTGRLDVAERPFYETEVYAPEHRLSYRFVWYGPDGTPVTSREYVVERACRYPLSQVPSDEAMFDISGRGEAAETERLFHISEALNREIIAYQDSTRLLGELRTKFNALQKAKESPGG